MEENKPMVVYFMASWCPICAKNWPVLSEVYPDYKDKLNLIATGIDPTDTPEIMSKLAEQVGFKFPLTWLPKRWLRLQHGKGFIHWRLLRWIKGG